MSEHNNERNVYLIFHQWFEDCAEAISTRHGKDPMEVREWMDDQFFLAKEAGKLDEFVSAMEDLAYYFGDITDQETKGE
jgi:hypothetical protein